MDRQQQAAGSDRTDYGMSIQETHSSLLVPIEATKGELGGIGRTSVYELIKSGDLQVVKIGRRSLITRSSIEAYVDRLSTAGVAETLPIAPRAASVAYRGTLAPCELPEVEDIKRVTYNPLDTIVLRVRGTLSADAADRLRYQIASQFRGHKVIVLDSGMTLDVLAPDEDDR